MAKYNNLGFTYEEAHLIDSLMVEWQSCGVGACSHSYIMTKEGEPVNRELDYSQPWDGSYYLSAVERSGPFTAVIDTGYGKLFLIDTLRGTVHYSNGAACATDYAVMLDAEYHGVENWLYVHELASKVD